MSETQHEVVAEQPAVAGDAVASLEQAQARPKADGIIREDRLAELARNRKAWPTFRLPQQRGTITVSDVVTTPPGDERDDMIRKWCMSVWDAWQESHAPVRALLQEALPRRV